MAKQLIISIDKDGYVKAEISGVKGPSCKKYISLVEELVNGKAVNEELTAEYHQEQTDQQNDSSLSNNI